MRAPGASVAPVADPPEPPPRITYVIGRLDRAVRAGIAAALEPVDLSVPEYTALSVLHRRTGLSNAQLARRTYVTPQSMIQVLGGLEARGLVHRSADPGHARIRRAALTPEGQRVVAVADVAVEELERRMLDGLGATREAHLRDDLVRCVRALGAGLDAPDAR